jgi:cell division protein FtsQ
MTTGVKRQSSAPKPAKRPRASVDPRIRERRVAVVRAQGRRRLRWLIAIAVFGILVAVGWLVIHSPLLDVDDVRVTGTQLVAPADVRRASGVRTGDALLFVDTGAAERRVEQLPWVDEASVERRLSGELVVKVTERRPAVWARKAPDTVALIDGRGRVLADVPDAPPDLPELSGLAMLPPVGQDIAPRAAVGVLGQLPSELAARVTRVTTDGGAVTLALRDGPELRLGPPTRVPAKARAALAVLGTITGGPPAYVDVRVPSAPVTG